MNYDKIREMAARTYEALAVAHLVGLASEEPKAGFEDQIKVEFANLAKASVNVAVIFEANFLEEIEAIGGAKK